MGDGYSRLKVTCFVKPFPTGSVVLKVLMVYSERCVNRAEVSGKPNCVLFLMEHTRLNVHVAHNQL